MTKNKFDFMALCCLNATLTIKIAKTLFFFHKVSSKNFPKYNLKEKKY